MKDPKNIYDFHNRPNKYSEIQIRNFIEKYPEQVHHWFWWRISSSQTLSEDFIRELQDKVDWLWISKYQTLSEDFIRDFQDKVTWGYILEFQILSEPFLIEFINLVEINWLEANEKIPEDVKQRIIDLKNVLESS